MKKTKEVNFKNLLKKTLTKFFLNLIKIPDLLPVINKINNLYKDYPVEKTSSILYDELKEMEDVLFSETYQDIFNLKLFEGNLDLQKIKDFPPVIKYLRLIYTYSKGCINIQDGKNDLIKYKKVLKKNTDIPNLDKLNELTENLPSNIGNLFSEIAHELAPEMKNIKLDNIDVNNPMGSLFSSGINIPNLINNIIPKIQNKLENVDSDMLSQELVEMMKKLKKN